MPETETPAEDLEAAQNGDTNETNGGDGGEEENNGDDTIDTEEGGDADEAAEEADEADSDNASKVFVGRLPAGTKENQLKELFSTYGEVTHCDIVGKYGFVVSGKAIFRNDNFELLFFIAHERRGKCQ